MAAAAKPSTKLVITSGRLRAWGLLSAMSLADQGLTSGAGFAVNMLLARWLAPDVYGAFAVAFSGFLFVSGFHNVLLLEPMSVIGPATYAANLSGYFRAQIALHAILVGALSGVSLLGGLILWMLAPGSPLVGAVTGAGLALPFLLLAWLARRMCYVMQRPSAAALGSALYLTLVAAGLFVLGHYGRLGPFTAFLLMGCVGILTSGLLLWRLGLAERGASVERGVTRRTVLRENWTYGRWLVGSAVLWSITSQAQVFLAAAVLGLGATGVLRAMQLPSLAMTQVTTAAGLLVLPAFSYEFGKGLIERLRHKAMLVSFSLFIGALSLAAILMLFSGRVEHLLFGGKYAAYAWLIPVLALMPVCTGFSMGYSMAMRAMRRPHFDLIANGVAAPIGVLSAIACIRWWGIAGAAVSMVISLAAYSWVYWFSCERSFRRWTREIQ